MARNIDFGTVADLYDVYVHWNTDIPFFLEACAKVDDEVLELMCGTGRLSIPLLERGIKLCCVDYSSNMLAVLQCKLQQRNLAVDLHEADVRELKLDRTFPLILLPFHSIAEILTPSDRHQALIRIRNHLALDGRFIVTLHNPAFQIPRLDGERRLICDRPIPDSSAHLRVWSTANYDADLHQGIALQEYEICSSDSQLLEQRELSLRFAIIDRPTFQNELESAGFRARNLWGDYSRNPFDPERSPYMIWELECDRNVMCIPEVSRSPQSAMD